MSPLRRSGETRAAKGERQISESFPGDPAGMIIGRYRVVREIGRGGMGRVFLAVTPARVGPGEQRVALKVVSAAQAADPRFRRRFLREAQALARVEHPNVLPVLGIEEDPERLYLVTRYAPGGDLRRVLRDRGSLPAREAAHVALQVAGALEAAHQAGVVHRDVKPGNVLLADRDRLDVYLGDFGLAQPLGETRLTQVNECIGTPDYMAPEQRLGQAIDPRTDLWALGLMLREMLTGDPRSTVDPAGAAITPTGRLLAVADGATRPDPANRYPSANAMAAAIRAALDGELAAPSPAPPPAALPAVAPDPSTIPPSADATTVSTTRENPPRSRSRMILTRVAAVVAVAIVVGGAAAAGTYLATRDTTLTAGSEQTSPPAAESPSPSTSPSAAPSSAEPSSPPPPSEDDEDGGAAGPGQPGAQPPSEPSDPGGDENTREVCADSATIRDKPASADDGAKIIGEAFKGDTVEFLGRSGGTWTEVETPDGVRGWMLSGTIARDCSG